MKKFMGAGLAFAVALAFSVPAIAADGAAIFKSKCAACHGQEGAGTAMAPAFKGNAFIKNSTEADITQVLKNGRNGAEKKYKQFAIGMPKQTLNDDEVKAVITQLKTWAK
jgi:mono/diheme cytochrome c family protein